MTVAHALLSGLGASASPSRASSGASSSAAGGGGSFGDALAKASQGGGRSARSERTEGGRDGLGGAASDAGADERDGAPMPVAQEPSALSAVLAVLAGGREGSPAPSETQGSHRADAAVALPESGPARAGDGGIWMPGQVRDAAQPVLDADRLLTLLSVDPVAADTGAAELSGEIKATVTGQETHLARESTRVGALARLAGAALAGIGRGTGEEASALPSASPPVPDSLDLAAAPAAAARPGEATARIAAVHADAAGQLASQARPGGAAALDGEVRGDRGAGPLATDGRGAAQHGVAGAGGFAASSEGGFAQSGGDGLSRGGGSHGAPAQQPANSSPAESTVLAAMPAGGVANAKSAALEMDPGALEASLSDQIAKEVRAELRAGGVGEVSSEGTVKVLQLELKPANLGAVTVRIALKDNAISVHIETQRRETAVAIERERDALLSALSSSGYTVDVLSAAPQGDGVRSGGFAHQGASAPNGAPFQAPAGEQGFASSSGGQGRPGEAGRGDSAYHGPAGGKDVADGGVRSDANGLYV